jgi:hypothetical protein
MVVGRADRILGVLLGLACHRSRAATVILVSALMLAACGSSNHSTDAASSSYSQAIKYASWIRSRGVPNYPDVDASAISALRLTMKASPAFRSAEQSCARLRPAAGGPRPIAEGTEVQLIAVARCMRERGVPDFPDIHAWGRGRPRYLGPRHAVAGGPARRRRVPFPPSPGGWFGCSASIAYAGLWA